MTVEQIAVVDDHRIVVGDDDTVPFSGRRTPGEPDDDEYVLVEVHEDLDVRTIRRPR